jgi:hypothetical protein
MLALGQLGSVSAARGLIRDSFETTCYEPRSQAEWEAARLRFARLPV